MCSAPDGSTANESTKATRSAQRRRVNGGTVKPIHERATGRPVLLAGLLAALNAACGSGAGEAPAKPTDRSRAALSTYHTDGGAGGDGVVTLRDRSGNPIARGSTTPYSPERTCGGCHDVDVITQGYHFQQGKGLSNTAITVSDTYNPARPWLLSDGMFGKW
jgi:hypothetical protein